MREHLSSRVPLAIAHKAPGLASVAFAISLGLAASGVLAGWLVSAKYGVTALACLCITLLFAALQERASGVAIGLALLAMLNGLPGVDLHHGQATISRAQDVTVVVFVGFLVLERMLRTEPVASYPLQRVLRWSSGALAAWWLLTVVRSTVFDGVTASRAALYGRDFVYFAIVLPLLCDFVASRPRIVKPLLATLGIGTAAYAIGQSVIATTNKSLPWLVHIHQSTVVDGTTRVYADMNGAVRVAFAFAIGAMLLAQKPWVRVGAGISAALFAASIVLQLTRAAYVAEAAGVVLVLALWALRGTRSAATQRRRLVTTPLVGIAAIAAVSAVSSRGAGLVGLAASRATTGLADIGDKHGTVGYRLTLIHYMAKLLGGHWLVGLGFLHPASRPVPGLPAGSIRNPDVGVLNGLMTFGVVGTVLLYVPLLAVVAVALRHGRAQASQYVWVQFGVAVATVSIVAGSLTLVDMFSLGGLQLVAVVIAVGVATSPASEPVFEPRHSVSELSPVRQVAT